MSETLDERLARLRGGEPPRPAQDRISRLRKEVEDEQYGGSQMPTGERLDPIGEIVDDGMRWGKGALEAGRTFAGSLIGATAGGAWAVLNDIPAFIRRDPGEERLNNMVDRIEKTTEAITYIPQTKEGQTILEEISKPVQWIDDKKKELGHWVLEQTGSPEMATMAYTAPDALLASVGARPFQAHRAHVEANALQNKAAELGIDLNAPKVTQREQVGSAGEDAVPSFYGESTELVSKSVQEAADVSNKLVKLMYRRAENGGLAGVPKDMMLNQFAPMVVNSLERFDVDHMPTVSKRLSELQQMADNPWEATTIKELENWRKRINANMPKKGTPEHAAMSILKGQYDAFMDHALMSDLLIGDPATITKWIDARQAMQKHGVKFNDQKALRLIREEDLTAAEARNLIFGAGQVGFKADAVRTVKALERAIGRNSPGMDGLRHDAMLNIVEPLLRQEPDLKAFVKRYDDQYRRNHQVMGTLFDETDLKVIRDFANAIEKHGRKGFDTDTLMGNVSQFVARMWVGHGIAKGQARIKATKGILDVLGASATTPTRMKILQEVMDYDPMAPLFPARSVAQGGALETLNQEPTDG